MNICSFIQVYLNNKNNNLFDFNKKIEINECLYFVKNDLEV